MASRRQVVRWSSVAIVAAFGAYVGFLALADRTLDRGFRRVPEGAAREQVIALLGPPHAVRTGCRDLPTWMNRPVTAVCAEELEYSARLRAVFWTVGFDEQGRAIAKYRYVAR
jgi:hypothetical protein